MSATQTPSEESLRQAVDMTADLFTIAAAFVQHVTQECIVLRDDIDHGALHTLLCSILDSCTVKTPALARVDKAKLCATIWRISSEAEKSGALKQPARPARTGEVKL